MSATEVLRSYGLSPEVDMSHPIQPDIRQARPNEFFSLGAGYLRYIENFVREDVVPHFLNDRSVIDRWNPAGYMVYTLGKNSLIGSVRLNFFPPPEQRKAKPEGPHIHDQAWHSVSLILAGEYREKSFDIHPAEASQQDTVMTYTQRRIEDDDVFRANGDLATVVPKGLTRRLPGMLHHVDAGRFIQSVVESSAVVLTVNSHPVRSDSTVVLPNIGEYFTSRREEITEEDIEIARGLILQK